MTSPSCCVGRRRARRSSRCGAAAAGPAAARWRARRRGRLYVGAAAGARRAHPAVPRGLRDGRAATGSDAHLAVGTGRVPAGRTTRRRSRHRASRSTRCRSSGAPSSRSTTRSPPSPTLSGLETYEAISTLAALLLALAALGFFLLARELLGAGAGRRRGRRWRSSALDRMVAAHRRCTRTSTRPGASSTLPFALVLALVGGARSERAAGSRCSRCSSPSARSPIRWRCRSRWSRSRCCCGPSAARLPPRRLRRGAPRRCCGWCRWRSSCSRRCCSAWLEKVGQRGERRRSTRRARCEPWGGDLLGVLRGGVVRRRCAPAGCWSSLAPVLAVGVVAARCAASPRRWRRGSLGGPRCSASSSPPWFRLRDFGWYFHFKVLAFVAPLALLVAVGRRSGGCASRVAAVASLLVLLAVAVASADRSSAGPSTSCPSACSSCATLDAASCRRARRSASTSTRASSSGSRTCCTTSRCARRRRCSARATRTCRSRAGRLRAGQARRRRGRADAVGPAGARLEDFALYRAAPGAARARTAARSGWSRA